MKERQVYFYSCLRRASLLVIPIFALASTSTYNPLRDICFRDYNKSFNVRIFICHYRNGVEVALRQARRIKLSLKVTSVPSSLVGPTRIEDL